MTENPGKMSCAEFQAQLPELIASGANAANHDHVKNCDLCRALLADLETIAEAARQLFPAVEPPDKLWAQIESAIKSESDDRPKSDDGPTLAGGLKSDGGPTLTGSLKLGLSSS